MQRPADDHTADLAVGINASYASIRDYVRDALTLREHLVRRYFLDTLGHANILTRWSWRLLGVSYWVTPALRWVGAHGPTKRVTPDVREKMLTSATDTEKGLPEFAHATAEFWVESLAADCCARFNLDSARVLGLRQINEMREAPTSFERLTSPQRFLAVSGVALGLFATLVPKEAFEALGWSAHTYGIVRALLAATILLIAAYLAAITFSERTGVHRLERRVSKAMPDVLVYCEIVCRSGDVSVQL